MVDLDWLRTHANGPDLRVLDVSPLHVYRERHIDAAEHAWWRDTVDPNYPVFGAVLTQGDDEAHRQQVLDSLALFTGDHVVVYDNEAGFRAARMVWFLRFLGFAQVALLNADYEEWSANAFPISPASTTSTVPAVDPQEGFYVVTEQLRTRIAESSGQIVDIRTDTERADDLGGQMPIGQIPGSVRLPWDRFINDDGHLVSPDEVLRQAEEVGLAPDAETVVYGSFGVDTALSWLGLRVAGFTNVLSYDRGWAEWSTLPDLPHEGLS